MLRFLRLFVFTGRDLSLNETKIVFTKHFHSLLTDFFFTQPQNIVTFSWPVYKLNIPRQKNQAPKKVQKFPNPKYSQSALGAADSSVHSLQCVAIFLCESLSLNYFHIGNCLFIHSFVHLLIHPFIHSSIVTSLHFLSVFSREKIITTSMASRLR